MYAVNLADIMVPGQYPYIAWLLGPVCPSRRSVEVDPQAIAGVALVLECDDARAEAVIALLRQAAAGRRGCWIIHSYYSHDGVHWRPIPVKECAPL